MKQLFHIENKKDTSGQQVLSIRLGEKHGCFAITDKAGSGLYELAYCSTIKWDEKELSAWLASYPSLRNSFYECQVAYDFPKAVLIPGFDTRAVESTALLDGSNNAATHVITEQVPGWQLNTVYAVPTEIHNWFAQQFPAAKYRHQYSMGIKAIGLAGEEGSLLVDFRADDFSVVVARGGKLLLAQSFVYTTPDDVLYYLLKICLQFELSQQETALSISGLIDRQSSLYKELNQYFIQIKFRDASWSQDTREKFPAHFFTSLNDLAQCAS